MCQTVKYLRHLVGVFQVLEEQIRRLVQVEDHSAEETKIAYQELSAC